jgi:hypothetical protein
MKERYKVQGAGRRGTKKVGGDKRKVQGTGCRVQGDGKGALGMLRVGGMRFEVGGEKR